MVKIIKNFILFLIGSRIISELDNLVSFLFKINLQTKNANVSHRISRILKLIENIKQAFGMLDQELKRLSDDLVFDEFNKRKTGR